MNQQVKNENVLAVVDTAIQEFPDKTGQVLNVLNEIQNQFRYLPKEALKLLAERTGIPYPRLYSIATFFDEFSMQPVGRYMIEVCDGTACHAAGAPRLVQTLEEKLGIRAGETTADGLITLRTLHCVGACSLAPIVTLDGRNYGRVKLNEIVHIVNSIG